MCYFDALSPYHTGKFDLNFHFYLQRLVCLHLLSSMQYKFFVDGEWRHDENQPFISCTYGMVNTVLLARESDYIPPPMSTAVSSLTNMDVDNEAFQQLVGASYTWISDIVVNWNSISLLQFTCFIVNLISSESWSFFLVLVLLFQTSECTLVSR